MSKFHLAYLSLGSNIKPEANLREAVRLLSNYGEVLKASSVWESEPVGTTGPNYLNACVLFKSVFKQDELKEKVTYSIETQLGRIRSADKFAPRTIDIDILIFDKESTGNNWLALAYVIVPLAEIYPDFQNPLTKEKITETATRLRQDVWMETRKVVLG